MTALVCTLCARGAHLSCRLPWCGCDCRGRAMTSFLLWLTLTLLCVLAWAACTLTYTPP